MQLLSMQYGRYGRSTGTGKMVLVAVGEVVPDAPEKIIVTDNFEASTFGSIGFLICTVSNFRLQFPIGVIIILIGVVRDEENLYNKRWQ